MLTALLPPWAHEGDTEALAERLRDPDARDRIRADIESDGRWENIARAAGTWENVLVTHTASGRAEGETVAAVAERRDEDPVDAVCDLLLEEDLDATMADFVMAEEDIERFLADDLGTVCTDGIFGGKPRPRAIGTFARVLERYVGERGVLSVERAVHRATGRAAEVRGLPDAVESPRGIGRTSWRSTSRT